MNKGHLLSSEIEVDRSDRVFETRSIGYRATFSDRSLSTRIFFVCWIVFSLHFATNTVREIYPALSLGDSLSFDVSEYAGLHPDIFEMPGRGTFINNNPGASILGSIPYVLFRPLTDLIVERVERTRRANPESQPIKFDTIYPLSQEFLRKSREKGLDVKFGLAAGIMQVFAMAPLSALGAVVMFWLLFSVTNNRRASLLFAFLYAFATPVLFRTAQLNQNMLVANFALFAFALLWRPWSTKASANRPFYFLAGLCSGWTVVLDYSGLVVVLAMSAYAFSKWLAVRSEDRTVQDLLRFAAGVGISAVLMMVYQWVCFGNPILPAQSYMPPANFTELGYRGFSFPQIDLFFETMFGFRYGLFTSAPILILAFLFPVWLRKSTRFLENPEIVFICAFTMLFFTFCAANQYGRMQFNTGVRHIVPVVPFVFLLTANVLFVLPRIVSALIGIVATYWSWCLAMYRDVEQGLGVFESVRHVTLEGFRFPWLTTLEKMGFVQDASAIPLLFLCGVMIWAILSVGHGRSKQEFS